MRESKDLNNFKVPQNMLQFYQNLVKTQNNFKPLTDVDLEKVDLEKGLAEGQPIVRLGSFDYSAKDFLKILKEIIEVTKKHRLELIDELSNIEDKLNQLEEAELKELLASLVLQKNCETFDKLGVSKELTKFILVNSFKPFIKITAEGLQGLEALKAWKFGYCPVCGWKPLMATVVEDQKRILHCSFCNFKWQYKALKCTECGNEDHDKMEYFTVPGDVGKEVLVCNSCKSYLKILRTKELMLDKNLALEDIKTIYLDLLAEGEGYTKGS